MAAYFEQVVAAEAVWGGGGNLSKLPVCGRRYVTGGRPGVKRENAKKKEFSPALCGALIAYYEIWHTLGLPNWKRAATDLASSKLSNGFAFTMNLVQAVGF